MHVDTNIRAVLLDLDDTITDRAASIDAYARQFMTDFGLRFQAPDLSFVSAEIARIDGNGYNRSRTTDLSAHPAWVSSPGAKVLAEHWDHHFPTCVRGRAELSPTIDTLLEAGVLLGVVTNGRTLNQRSKLEVLGLYDRLGAVLISEECGFAKPDARIFLAAAAALAVEPTECIFIGDNPENDVLGALAVGMRGVWFRASLEWPQHLPRARESIGNLSEVLALQGLDLTHS